MATLKKDQKLGFKTKYCLMQVKSIAECSPWSRSILQYFRPSVSYHLSWISLFCLFLSGRLRQFLLCTVKPSPPKQLVHINYNSIQIQWPKSSNGLALFSFTKRKYKPRASCHTGNNNTGFMLASNIDRARAKSSGFAHLCRAFCQDCRWSCQFGWRNGDAILFSSCKILSLNVETVMILFPCTVPCHLNSLKFVRLNLWER